MPIFQSDYKELGSTLLERYLILGSLRQVQAWCEKNDILSSSRKRTHYTHQGIKNVIWRYAALHPEHSYEVVKTYFSNKPLVDPPTFDEWFGHVVWYAVDNLSPGQYRRFVEKYPNVPEILDEFKTGQRELAKVG